MEEVKGKIHSIETFGTLDGPGIRFVLFMQGCALHCKFCHNRDTWETSTNNLMTTDEVIENVKKCDSFIKFSKGGVTVSGGEPLLQVPFLIELFTKLKTLGYHTAIDTSGMFEITPNIRLLLKLTDLVLLDIKQINDAKCKDLCGFSNKLELEFAKYLSNNNIPMWIRYVLVPKITDDEKDLLNLKEFIDTLKTVEKIEIHPYHNIGRYKWKNLGLEYPLEGVPQATEKDVLRAKKILGIS
ncbi:MAG: pyruvate formate-lyase-activating protein [Clostridia bacterium]